MIELNKIYNEPCLETLRRMPNDFLDCVITSPPYWQLRDYGYPGQWGLEPTFNEYLENLWSLMDEIFRVLKPTGTVWVNLGDTYGGNNSMRSNNGRAGFGNPREQIVNRGISKCLMLIPHRFAIGCIERGWIVRNDIIWAKRNGMPDSVTDRFTKKHEYFFFMVKSEKYFFDLDSIRDKVSQSSIERYKYEWNGNEDRSFIEGKQNNMKNFFKKKSNYSVIEKENRNAFVEIRNLPNHDELREYLSNAKKVKGISIEKIEKIFGNFAPHHWFEKNGSYPSANDWIKLKNILNFDEKFDFQMTNIELKNGFKQNNPKGKNPGDVSDFWDVPTKPNRESHYAQYSDDLIKKPILAGCPEGGIIYDPFMGSGSTAEAAIRANRKFIGSEMSTNYIEICNKRLKPYLSQTTLF